MIMELMDCDLQDYIRRGALSDDQVVYIIAEVARGMNHIHKKDCFHRDLKPQNILLKKSIVTGFNVDVKIVDFGSSELVGVGDINRTTGTIGYKAPEQFDSILKLFPDKVDVFGFGALCFKILTGKKPYESHMNVREAMKQLDRASISRRKLSEDVVQIIWECLNINPESRPNFEKISSILDGALLAIREKMPRPLAPSTSTSLHSKESMLKRFQGHDYLMSILHNMGLSKKDVVHFIPFEELLVISLIGVGSFARIYKVEWKGILYAQKVFTNFSYEESFFKSLPKLSHKNIITFMGYSLTSENDISIIMELQAMDLSWALHLQRNNACFDVERRMMIVKEIAEGMRYLHDQGVVHGDLKPGNVVLSRLDTNDITIKLIDFPNNMSLLTTRYAAPEQLKKLYRWREIDMKKCDVYSFGIVCCEILAGVQAFTMMNGREFREAILKGERPLIPFGTSLEMECLIKSCWSGDPQERPNFSEICERLSQTLHY